MASQEVLIRPTTEADWREVRAIRLEMVADTPIAYLDTLETTQRLTERDWRARASRTSATSVSLAAIRPDGTWVASMGAYVPRGAIGAMLVGVYVTPTARGRAAGVFDAMLDAIEDWARERGPVLTLEVNELNPRARAAYERRGFVLTGVTSPYPLDPPSLELEMMKRL
jgi:GNAT superfamily N-acetyltransferase